MRNLQHTNNSYPKSLNFGLDCRIVEESDEW